MIYRDRVEFAVGHGISVHATVSEEDGERATEVKTAVLPEYEIQVTETPGLEPEDRPAMRRMIEDGLLDMERLAEEQDYVRELLQLAVIDDLLGPADGPFEEIVGIGFRSCKFHEVYQYVS